MTHALPRKQRPVPVALYALLLLALATWVSIMALASCGEDSPGRRAITHPKAPATSDTIYPPAPLRTGSGGLFGPEGQ